MRTIITDAADLISVKEFFKAVETINFNDVKRTLGILKQKEISPRIQNFEGLSCLHLSVLQNSTKVCKYFLADEHLDINILDAFQNTPLHIAAVEGNLNMVEFLIKRKSKVNVYNELGLTPLHFGAGCGNLKIVNTLLENGAEVNPTGQAVSGMPLHHAISNNFNIKVVHRLLEMKARPDEMVFGVTPLLRASLKGNFELTILLLENNASTKFTVEEGMLQPLDAACLIPDPIIAAKVVEQLLLGGTDPDYINFIGCKPIEIAANAGNRKAVEYLFSDTTVLETWDPNITWDVDAIMSYYANTDINSKLLAYIWRLLELGDTELIGGEESDNLQRACHHYYHALLLYRDFPTGPPYELVICKLSRCLLKLKDAYWALAEAEECMRCLHSGAPEGTKAKEDFVLRHPKRVFIAELSFCIAKASHYMKRHEKALIFYEYARFVDDKEEYLRGHEICLEETKNGLYSCAGASTSTSGT